MELEHSEVRTKETLSEQAKDKDTIALQLQERSEELLGSQRVIDDLREQLR